MPRHPNIVSEGVPRGRGGRCVDFGLYPKSIVTSGFGLVTKLSCGPAAKRRLGTVKRPRPGFSVRPPYRFRHQRRVKTSRTRRNSRDRIGDDETCCPSRDPFKRVADVQRRTRLRTACAALRNDKRVSRARQWIRRQS